MIIAGKIAALFRPPIRSPLLRIGALAIVVLFSAPVVAVIFGAFGEETGATLTPATLAHYVAQTALYAAVTIFLALLFALPAAWLTVMHRFPGRRFVSWALYMPLALPPYIVGHGWSHFLETQFRFYAYGILPAAVVTALAVYPYIYIFTRAALRQQSRHLQSAARLMGYSPFAACRTISLPLARPAIVVGIALALMETLNDIAVAELFGAHTLGFGVYDLWLNRDNLSAACRLSAILMLFVIGILAAEEYGRRKQKLYAAQCDRRFAGDLAPVRGLYKYLCAPLLLMPALGGFFLPTGWYAVLFSRTKPELWRSSFLEGLDGTLFLSCALVVALFIFATITAADKRKNGRGALMTPIAKLSQSGYALPGTILAQGYFMLALATGGGVLIATGGLTLVILACSARFFILAANAAETGLDKISPQLDAAARLAKKSAATIFFRVHLPLMRPAVVAGAALVFLEGVKELPMTLILRPYDFNTLATMVYQYASDESPELAAPPVLAIAAIGTTAVTILFQMEKKLRQTEN